MSYIFYNPNPSQKMVGDCVIRGVSRVTHQNWDDTYMDICMCGYAMKDMPSSNNVWENYLIKNGFIRTLLPDTCPNCYTVRDFCLDFPHGTYLLATGGHVIAVENGDYYDAWDSGNEVPIYYWKEKEDI